MGPCTGLHDRVGAPLPAQHVAKQPLVGAGRHAVEAPETAHDAVRPALGLHRFLLAVAVASATALKDGWGTVAVLT